VGKKSVKLLVVIPVGPESRIEFVKDTVGSVLHFTQASRHILLVDNTGVNACAPLGDLSPDIKILVTPETFGKGTELYLTGSYAYQYALDHYEFEVILRLDTDALVIGKYPELDAIQTFACFPEFGALGSYLIDCNGEPREFWAIGNRVQNEQSFFPVRSFFNYWHGLPICPNFRGIRLHLFKKFTRTNFRGFLLLRKLYKDAIASGYNPGEHFMGGAVFFSYDCIRRLDQAGLLYRLELRWSTLSDDHLLSLMLIATGMKIGDFSTGDLPMGIRWKGLPCSPAELLSRNKKVTHSTKFWQNMSEVEIRDYFREKRQTR